jgi:hypothetical protein
MHWAAEFIALPWSRERDCWWLVRMLCLKRWGLQMPLIAVDADADNTAAIQEIAGVAGWRPASEPPQDGDIMLCRDLRRRRHVGMIVEADRRLLLVHNDGYQSPSGPVGSVVAQTLADAIACGLSDIEFWRRAA